MWPFLLGRAKVNRCAAVACTDKARERCSGAHVLMGNRTVLVSDLGLTLLAGAA